ncbi:MAG: tetratricopeptide repeat protein [Candidatus Ozemobacteraceae bacterium]
MSTRGSRRFPLFIAYLALTWMAFGLAVFPVHAAAPDMDFGLPIFGNEEIRLEREKQPSFNISLVKKFLGESQGKPLVQLHAISNLIKLLRLSDESRAKELVSLAHSVFKPASLEKATNQELLNHVYFEGMLLVRQSEIGSESMQTGEPESPNAPDIAFEKILLSAEEKLADMPDYNLVKGMLFHLLKNRPNGYFSQMKPVEDLKRAAASAPVDPFFHFALGQAFRILGTDENTLFFAVLSFEKACALAPANGKLHHTVLGIYMGLHESYQSQKKHEPFWLEEAVYKKIITLSPNNPHALNNLGFLYAEYGIHRQLAQQLCQKAVDMIPANAGFRDSLGWAAFKNGQFEKAEQELSKALQMSPEGYEPHYHLGTLYYVTKRPDKAIAMYDRAVTFNPSAAEALNNFAFLLAENDRDLGKAYDLAIRANRLDPENPSYIDTLGWIEYKRGNSPEALRHLKKAVNLAPDVGEILSHMGRIYLEAKDFDSALSYLTQAIKADPSLDNLQKDVYMAVSLKAIHRAIADYHRLFGAKAQPAHLKGFLLQLARLHQEEGEFPQAIAANQLCDKLQRNELDLSKPLFDFYTIDIATPTAAVASGSAPASSTEVLNNPLPGEVTGDNSEAVASESAIDADDSPANAVASAPTAFPDIARVCVALNVGPAFFRYLTENYLPLSPDFSKLSATLFLRRINRPFEGAILQLEIPGLHARNSLGALEEYLHFFCCEIQRDKPPLPGYEGFTTFFGKHALWVLKQDDRLLIGLIGGPTPEETEAFSRTFPWAEDGVVGFLIDWPAGERQIPFFLKPWLENPLFPYLRLYARYREDGPVLREISLLEPAEKVDQYFMKFLAEELFYYKTLLLRFGCRVSLKVEANPGCVRLTADYEGISDVLRDLEQKIGVFGFFLKPRINEALCALRRGMCGAGQPGPALCPDGGNTFLQPETGAYCCSIHHDVGFFPMLTTASERCLHSRSRLEGLIERLRGRGQIFSENELLPGRLGLEYTVSPCPAQGVYHLNEKGKVTCSVHSIR